MAGLAGRARARAALIAGTLLVLTVAGHSAGGGSAPDLVGLAIATILATALALAASSRRLGIGRLLVLLLGGQALLHVVLSLAGGHDHGSSTTAPSVTAMVAGHVVAAALAAVVVTYADELIDRWIALVQAALGATPAVAAPGRPGKPTGAVAGASLRTTIDILLHQVIRRGPPARTAFSSA